MSKKATMIFNYFSRSHFQNLIDAPVISKTKSVICEFLFFGSQADKIRLGAVIRITVT